MNPLTLFQMVGLYMAAIGLGGLIWRRSLVGMIISLELMLNGAGLSIVAAAQLTPADAVLGQLGALFIMGLAAAEAALILAIILIVVKRFHTADAGDVSQMRG